MPAKPSKNVNAGTSSKRAANRLEIAKVLVGPGIALFVAAVGWILTEKYNSTQLEVAIQRNSAEVEVARINAALRYLELIRNIPQDDVSQRRQAVAIAAAVLPPDLAFRLAVEQLPDSTALDALMAKYKDNALAYLARHLEMVFGDLKQVLDPIPVKGPYATQPSDKEKVANVLLQYVRDRGYPNSLFRYLVSDRYDSDLRAIALLLYFNEYRQFLQGQVGYVVQEVYQKTRAEQEFQSYMNDSALSLEAKQAIAFAGSIVFGPRYDRSSDTFIREAAKRYWLGLDIRRGATPVEGTIRSHIYSKIFHYDDSPRTDAVALASANLRSMILDLNLRQMEFDNIRLLLYAYATSVTVGQSRAYLVPADVVVVIQAILNWADTATKRQNLSMELGSASGSHLFLNMLPNCNKEQCAEKMQPEEIAARCTAARSLVELLLNWYGKVYATDWYIPKFFDEAINEFPELESRVNRSAWGLGGPWKLESSRGCRV